MDDLRTRPCLSPSEAEDFWATSEDRYPTSIVLFGEPAPASAAEPGAQPDTATLSVGIDMPGVGVVPAAECSHEVSPRRSGREDAGAEPPATICGSGGGDLRGPRYVPSDECVCDGGKFKMPGNAVDRAPEYVVGEVPEPLRGWVGGPEFSARNSEQFWGAVEDWRERLLIRLLFAARALAKANVTPRGMWTGCIECLMQPLGPEGIIRHRSTCRTGTVLEILHELEKLPRLEILAQMEGGAR